MEIPDDPQSLTDCLCNMFERKTQGDLEEYRKKYEAKHGPTDLTRRYSSTWPRVQQEWLMKHDPRAYFNGLPPFVKAFLKGKFEAHLRMGSADDLPDDMIALYMSGGMVLDHENQGRGR